MTELYMCIKEAALIGAVVFLAFAMQGCGTMKAATDLGKAMFNDMGMVVEGTQDRMVQEYRE
jgi:hypothetical protein